MDEYSGAQSALAKLGLKSSKSHWSNTLVVAEALNRGIEVSAVKRHPRIVLRHGTRRYRWSRGRTTFNTPLARTLGQYKDVQSRLFLNKGIIAPENAVFSLNQATRAWAWAQSLGKLVVKPHDGLQGREVHVGITTWDEFEEAFNRVAIARGKVLVEKFHLGTEHRCLVVKGKLIAATRRRPASVLGDGDSTIEQLVATKNTSRGLIHVPLKLGAIELGYLGKHNLTPRSVPKTGERIYLTGTSNIHTGGDAIDATDEISREEREMVEKAVRSVPGLNVVGMDVLLPRSDGDSEPTIIEINANPMITMHHFPAEGTPRNVASAIMDAMFPATMKSQPDV